MDRVSLTNVRVYGRHGTEAAERARRQPFDIDVTAEIDLNEAAATDDLAHTLDYASLRDRFVRIVATTSYALLERLAADLLDAVFEDRRVRFAEITIAKPAILDGATPAVTLARPNPRYSP